MSELISAKDWSATPLGPIDSWPASLRTTVSLCLASNFPINIIWGPEAIQIYNIGYRVVCGSAHPQSLGESYRITWASAWPAIGEPFDNARQGQTSFLENQRMFLERNGYLEETFFTFSLSPILNELGEVVGLFHPVTETTAAMLSERRTRALRDIANRAGSADSSKAACGLIIETLAQYSTDVAFAKIYSYTTDTDSVQLLGTTIDDSGNSEFGGVTTAALAGWPFGDVLATGKGMLVLDVLERAGAIACSDYGEMVSRAFVVPIRTKAIGPPFGFAVIGLSTRLAFNAAYKGFVEMLGEAIGVAVGAALAYQAERQRADELTALDQAKTAFFSNVSHEFRTPLTLMLGPLQDALDDTQEPLGPGQRARHALVNRNALRLLKLVNTLLDFSRIQAGRVVAAYSPTDLPLLTTGLASAFGGAIEKAGLVFKVDIQELGEAVFVDHDMWEKVVLNLLSNAFKFTFEGEIELQLEKRGDFAHLTVRDTGIGIPAEEMPNLFQRFHRVEGVHGRTYEGSGIGLALVSEIVKLHGGTVSVKSQPGTGSAFEVAIPFGSSHLPAHQVRFDSAASAIDPLHLTFVDEASGWLPNPSSAYAADSSSVSSPVDLPAHSPGSLAPGRRRRILIAEDNADMRAYLTGLLHSVGELEAVEDGLEALESIRRSRPDLIISDVMMPHLDGLALLARLRADPAMAGIPFMLLSARAGEESRIEGLRLGADDYLVKPFSANELVARVSTQLKLGEVRSLAEMERNRLYEFFMQAQIPLVILQGADYRFFLANEPYEKLVGKKVVGKTVLELFTKLESDLLIPLLDQVYNTGEALVVKEVGFRLAGKDGVMEDGFIDLSYHPFREASGEITGLLAMVIDVTEHVRARTKIKNVVARLTEERELRERFVFALTHDLRTPLSVVHMAGVLLKKKVHEPQELTLLANRIVNNAKRADVMICDLLDANHIQGGQQMPVVVTLGFLDEIVAAASEELSEVYGKRFRVSHESVPLPGLWDGKSIRRVVENLVGNAFKYGKPDGPVTLGLSASGDWVDVTVHNEGNALSSTEQEEIFAPFYRTPSASSGTQPGWGVGLTLVKGIAQAHGGSVRVESTPDDGTTFLVQFPIDGKADAA